MTLSIEVVYAGEQSQTLIPLKVPDNTTVEMAIKASGILENHPEILLTHNTVGIFSCKVALDDKVAEGDRIEIYRSLLIDPKEARRRRAR